MESYQICHQVGIKTSRLKNTFAIAKYIYRSNKIYQLPKRFFLALLYQLQKRFYQNTTTIILQNQKKMLLFPQSPISSALVYSYFPDQKEIDALRKFISKNTVFLDIGANIGYYSVCMMDLTQHIYAFEPDPETANYAKINFLLNHFGEDKIKVNALGEKTSTMPFHQEKAGSPTGAIVTDNEAFFDSSFNIIQVPMLSLDEWIQSEKFSKNQNFVLKIDVEGYEEQVFEGAKHFLKNHTVSAILFECFNDNTLSNISNQLIPLGYNIKNIHHYNYLAYQG